jgi:hypothetical protein
MGEKDAKGKTREKGNQGREIKEGGSWGENGGGSESGREEGNWGIVILLLSTYVITFIYVCSFGVETEGEKTMAVMVIHLYLILPMLL